MSGAPFNYGAFFGIQSAVAAFVFAAVYLCLSVWHIIQAGGNFNRVYKALIVFCIIRLVAFVLRGIIAASDSAAQNSTLVTVYEVLSSTGFLGLLFASYLLVLTRFTLVELVPPSGLVALFRNARLFSLAMTAVVVTGIVGVIQTNDGRSSGDADKASLGDTLRKVSTALSLVLTIIQTIQTLLLVKAEEEGSNQKNDTTRNNWGTRNGHWVLLCIAILFLIREVFLVATISNSTTQSKEIYWYPFVALTEVLATLFYAIPGVIPREMDIPRYAQTQRQHVPPPRYVVG